MNTKFDSVSWLKIFFAILFVSIVPVFVIGIFGYYQLNHIYKRSNVEVLTRLCENRRVSIEQFFDERVGQLFSIANTESLHRIREQTHLAVLLNMARLQSKVFLEMEVVDQTGDRLSYAGTADSPNQSVNYSNEPWFHAIMSSGIYISNVYISGANVPQLFIGVTKQEGPQTWILRATMRSDVLDEMVKSGHVCSKGDAFIVDANNILQTAPCYSGKLLGHPTIPAFASAIGSRIDQTTFQDEGTLFASAELTRPKWVLVIKQDCAGGIGAFFRPTSLQILIFLSAILIVATLAAIVSRYITNHSRRALEEASKTQDPMMQWNKMAALGKMAAGIAHEINNPLAIIGEKAGWMKDLLGEDDVARSENFRELQDCVNKIRDQVERCKIVTHHLLRFGRRIAPIQEMVDVNQILAETVALFESEASFRDIAINTSYDQQLPRISTDPTQLQQVFLNIIDNAIDAVDKSGMIAIRTCFDSASGRQISIEISDSGPGIPRHLLGQIFDPFFTTKKMADGRGLGLSISYGIMERLGGEIQVKSEQRKGTTFTICLPVE